MNADCSFVIRPVTEADAGDWQRMREELWPGDDHVAETQCYFSGQCVEPEAVMIAVDEAGEPVGFVELSSRRDVPGLDGIKTGYIEGLFVDQRCRRSSLAWQLLRASQHWARANDCRAFASDRDDRVVIDPKYQNANAQPDPDGCRARDNQRSS